MAIVTSENSPSCCTCVIRYEFDADLNPEDPGFRTTLKALWARKCPAHADLTDQECVESIFCDEQYARSMAINDLLERHPELVEETVSDPEGRQTPVEWLPQEARARLKPEQIARRLAADKASFRHAGDRSIVFALPGLTPPQRQAFLNRMAARFPRSRFAVE